MAIAVLDVGKSNAKILLLDDAGQVLAQRARPCGTLTGPLYPELDVHGIWSWAVAALGEIAAIAPVECIVPVAHGAAAVLMAGEELALPALDYEHDGPNSIAGALARELDPFAATGSPVLPLGLCVGAQLYWQEQTFPKEFARVTEILPLAQYWAWRLSGVKATEVTSLGAHTHLWRPAEGRFSELARRRGWAERFPPMRRAWDTLGTVRPELAAATGLPADCRVLAGIHDSNASYLPHLVARAPPFTVLSTGTWIIAMAPGLPLAQLDAHADMLANVDAHGEPVPTARFMGGREVELVAGADALRTPAARDEVAALVAEGVMALPSFVAGSGPFIGRQGGIKGDVGTAPGRRAALASLYAALTVDVMLDQLESAGPVLVEGSFHRNAAFCGLLAALRCRQTVHAIDDPSGTARGAWLLARWQDLPSLPATLPAGEPAWAIPGLDAYRELWRRLSDS